jgi:Spy/CpxP family protein refolding chaperone
MKSSSFMTGLALALSLSAAGAASAQNAQSAQRPARGVAAQADSGFRRGGRGGRGGPEGMLLRGINLTDSQKARVEALRANARKQFEKEGGRIRPDAAQGQSRDAAAIAARRAEMEKRREQRIASLRSILDAQQRTQFDKNVAELKAHGPRQGRQGGDQGEKDGHQ